MTATQTTSHQATSPQAISPHTDAATAAEGTGAPSGAIEAILLSVDRPVPAMRLALALGLVKPPKPRPAANADRPEGAEPIEEPPSDPRIEATVARLVGTLNDEYAATNRSFRIETLAGGYRIMTRPEFAPFLATFHRQKVSSKLSRAAVESLAIVAYKQPLTRAQLEAIRGVACGEVLRSLMDRRLVTIKGRAEELGRPMLYGTTKGFLDRFGLASIKDLPSIAELKPTP